jgi:hypothetical protein
LASFGTSKGSQEGKLDEARRLLERTLDIRVEKLEMLHPSTAHSRDNLAEALRRLTEFNAAEPLFAQALTDFEARLGPVHPNTNRVRSSVAHLCIHQGNITQGIALTQVALSGHEVWLGKNHRWTRDAAAVMAVALERATELRASYGILSPIHPR